MTESKPAARWQGGDFAALIGVVALVVCVRCLSIDATPSVDEIWHLAMSRGLGSPVGRYAFDVAYPDFAPLRPLDGAGPAWSVWTHMNGFLHPPLYVLTLRLWREAFGTGLMPAHALSIVWSAVATCFTFAAARLALGRAAAVWAGALVAVAPVQIYFGQEIRGYEQMIAIGAATLWMATRIEVFGPTIGRAIWLAALLLPLLLTHYFSVGAAAGIAAYATVRLRGAPLKAYLATTVATAALYVAAWVPFAWRQVAALNTGDAFTKVDRVEIGRELLWAVAVPLRVLAERPWIENAYTGALLAALGGAMLVLPWLAARRVPSLRPWAAWLCGGILAIVALDVVRSTFVVGIVRYIAVVSPAVPLIVVGLCRGVGPRAMHAASAALVAAMLLVRPSGPAVLTDAPNFGGMAAWLAGTIAPGDAILVVEGTAGEHTNDLVLLTLADYRGLFPRTVVKVRGPMTADALRALPDRAWAVMVDPDPAVVDRALGGATLVASYGIPGEGLCNLYDLAAAKAAATTRPASP